MKRISLGFLLVVTVFSVTFFGCTKKSDNQNQLVYEITLSTSPTLGQYLVDKDGYTLYFFSNDYDGINTCAGGCAAIWPYFNAGTLTQANLGNGLLLSDFDTIHAFGTVQTRYKGWPLYYYAPSVAGAYGGATNVREAPGLIGGEGYGNIWFVAKPDYSLMLANGQLTGSDGKNYTSTYVLGNGNTLYFTDPKGLSLYTFSRDSAEINKYTHADLGNNSVWPIYETDQIVVPSILDKTLFSSIMVFGRMQLTYKGWPLYFFGGDNNTRGNTNGITVPAIGVWPIAVQNVMNAPSK
jgi:predicted lipoprotein with Yx(FWY)xxD motif